MKDRFKGTELVRRDLVRVGALSAIGLGVCDLLGGKHLQASESIIPARAKACILIWLDGGPSHLETFDPKPDAPAEVRGPLASIATSVPGIRISECLPKTASLMHHLALVRSMTSPLGEHNFGTHYLMTGYKPTPVLEYPSFGAVLAHLRERSQEADDPASVLPQHVAVPDFRVGGSRLSGSGYLPGKTAPFSLGGDPAREGFSVRDLDPYSGIDVSRLNRRRKFSQAFDRFGGLGNDSAETPADSELKRAFDLITSKEAKQAFELESEPEAVRKRYGLKTVGQSCLLARRLVERGVPFVTVNHRGWDTHENLYTRLKEGYTGAKVDVGLVPSLDLALSALVQDLAERSLLDETLIVVMGEFGRTPKLNTQGGRDHWPRVFSSLLAGGGVAGGQVVGSSDAVGELPADHPVTPSDLAATIYHLLGIDPTQELKTPDGRRERIAPAEARVVQKLLG
ncbi:MAG: DUF1501 domain-containing protein [Planctomycetota bacterium]